MHTIPLFPVMTVYKSISALCVCVRLLRRRLVRVVQRTSAFPFNDMKIDVTFVTLLTSKEIWPVIGSPLEKLALELNTLKFVMKFENGSWKKNIFIQKQHPLQLLEAFWGLSKFQNKGPSLLPYIFVVVKHDWYMVNRYKH